MNELSLFNTSNLIVVAITIATVVTAVMFHYEVLNWLYRYLPTLARSRRPRMILLIGVIMLAHTIEIWLFGTVYWLVLQDHSLGSITGVVVVEWFDCVYFSAATFTTVGYGDLVMNGPIRMLVGTEALAGLVMITWSASFTIGEMQREWKD